MDGCCGPPDASRYDDVFDERFARRVARRYAAKGPTAVERRIVAFAAGQGLQGASILEVGGGVGELQLELLARGADESVNLELSHEYEAEAERLIAHAGMTGRVTRVVGVDLALAPESVSRADIVVLNRVVCCYSEAARLLAAAAGRARRAIVYSHPPRNWLTVSGVALQNGVQRLARRSYRGYVHRPEVLVDAIRREGFEVIVAQPGFSWWTVGAVRAQ